LNIGWYPAQATAKVTGVIRVGEETIQLDRAPGYQDRNWGKSFPKWWSWVVANHWNEGADAVLVAGGGAPKVLGRPSPYEGMSIGFRYNGESYAFRPTDGVFPWTDIRFGKWEMRAQDIFGNRIEVSAYAPEAKFMDLQFLTPQGEIFHDWEALAGDVKVKFTPFSPFRRRPIWLTSSFAGIEYGSH
jgi:tocopherol cyclase